jgi:hypothetical protein
MKKPRSKQAERGFEVYGGCKGLRGVPPQQTKRSSSTTFLDLSPFEAWPSSRLLEQHVQAAMWSNAARA